MVNIIDTPPRTEQRTARDRVSLLEVVGCAALLSTVIWSVIAVGTPEALSRTSTLLNAFAIWVVAGIAWASLLYLGTRSFARTNALIVALIGGAFLPLALFFGGIAQDSGEFTVTVVPATIAMVLVTGGTPALLVAPRMVRGIAAIAGFLAILVFFTVALGQAFLAAL